MSANTSILEGGNARSFGPVTCLMVQGDDGKYYPWYPEADRQLESLSVDKNGIYRASKYGVYGWSRVSVNVPQIDRVTGRDPDTGEEKTVTSDPDTGELVETVVPVEIRVVTPPTKTEYTNGVTIDYSGIVVHAYSATGQDMGAVPFGELVFPITTAQGGDEWSDGQGLNATEITYMPVAAIDTYGQEVTAYVSKVLGEKDGYPSAYGSFGFIGKFIMTRYNGGNYALWINGDMATNMFSKGPYGGYDSIWHLTGGAGAPVYNDKFTPIVFEQFLTDLPSSTVDPTTVKPANLHATQSLPVQWSRTGDGAILETSFNITVTGGE